MPAVTSSSLSGPPRTQRECAPSPSHLCLSCFLRPPAAVLSWRCVDGTCPGGQPQWQLRIARGPLLWGHWSPPASARWVSSSSSDRLHLWHQSMEFHLYRRPCLFQAASFASFLPSFLPSLDLRLPLSAQCPCACPCVVCAAGRLSTARPSPRPSPNPTPSPGLPREVVAAAWPIPHCTTLAAPVSLSVRPRTAPASTRASPLYSTLHCAPAAPAV